LRLILPFIDHGNGGVDREHWRRFMLSHRSFYDVNSQTIKAYQNIIKQVIAKTPNRPPFIYKKLMAWETGNELKDSTKHLEQTGTP